MNKIHHYFYHTKHAGQFDPADGVCIGEEKNAACDHVVKFYLKINNKKIIDARFQAVGAVALIAGAEYLCEYVIGKSFEEASKLSVYDLMLALEMETIQINFANMLIGALRNCLSDDSA